MDKKTSEEERAERRALVGEAKKAYFAVPPADNEMKKKAFEKWLELAETFEEVEQVYKASPDSDIKRAAWLKLVALISSPSSP